TGATDFSPQEPRDQEPRDDEEDVHPDESATETAEGRVEQHDGQHGDGAQALDVRAELLANQITNAAIAPDERSRDCRRRRFPRIFSPSCVAHPSSPRSEALEFTRNV